MQVSPTSVRPGGYKKPVILVLLFVALAIAGSAWASGWPPFAREDSIVVNRGGTVSVLESGASSVLDNDFDIEGDELFAVLTRDVKHGSLQLDAFGKFVYTHDGKGRDKDEFRYRANDGTGNSRETKVKIKIENSPNNPPFTIGSPPDQAAFEGAFFQLALSPYFGDLDADDTLRYSASGLPGNRLEIDENSGLLSGTPNSSDVREAPYTVRITATDNAGDSASVEFDLQILSDRRADLDLTAEVAVNPVLVGEATQWNISVQNRGPANLDEGELVAKWATSGPALALSAPANCTLSDNNTPTPTVSCSLDGLSANDTARYDIQGTQSGAGDNSLIAIAISDDPNMGNNSELTGAVVVSAFSEGPTQIISAAGGDVVSGDFDGDGAMDIVVSGGQTIVYFNSGNRTVATPGVSLGADSGGNAVAVLDWDGDDRPDIAVAGMSSRAGRVYLNDGSGKFDETVDLNVSDLGTVVAAAAADFDLDGDDDLVLAGSGNATLLRSSGATGFAITSLPAGSGIDAAVADVNNDGLDDIIVVQAINRIVRVMRNAGDGRSFSSQSLDRGSVSAATPQDVDGDGDIDLLLAVDDGELEVPLSRVVYQQAGDSFSEGTVLGASPLSKMLAGDIDGDGVPDVIAINESGVHQVYRGLPSGGFSLNAEQIVSDGMRRGVIVDFNGDESLDLIFAGLGAGVVEIHANNGIGRLGFGDRVAPLISLNGDASMQLAAGQEYVEMGATASDDIDGDLSDQVTISGSVNTSVVGTYSLTYTAIDRATNNASVQRSVQVGVNQGQGGSGGGTPGPVLLILLLLLVTLRRQSKIS
ncbi:MAG: hypothetical protein ACI88G_000182 [Woeseiaceae bacterium]